MTHGRVLKIEGNVITLDTELARDYAVKRNAIIINHFPIVEAYRRVMWDDSPYIRRIVIEDITVEGNLAENPTPISDWTTSAIHLTMVGRQHRPAAAWCATGSPTASATSAVSTT